MSAPACPPAINPVAQRLKDLSEIDDNDDDELVRVAFQKWKVVSSYAFTPKKTKKAQLATEHRVSILPSSIPQRIQTRATKANPKIGDKE